MRVKKKLSKKVSIVETGVMEMGGGRGWGGGGGVESFQ